MSKSKSKLLVEDIFDPHTGWSFSENEVPVRSCNAEDGNPVFFVDVDGIEILVFQISEWEAGTKSNIAPHRIVAMVSIADIEITDPSLFLRHNNMSHGMPAYSIDEEGDLTIETAFPIGPNYPVDLARRQLMVCMGLIAEVTTSVLQELEEGDSQFDWDTAKKVAGVAGIFLSALIGITNE